MALREIAPDGGVEGLKVAIVGLGLMGGSFAKALKRGTGAIVTGYGRNQAALQAILDEGVLDHAMTDPVEAIRDADLTVVCLNPEIAVHFIVDNMPHFKQGAVVTDICGVKQQVIDGVLPHLRPDVGFVPAHPMAGRERSGYQYAVETLFDKCNYIITPIKCNSVYHIELVKRFAGALGASSIVLAAPLEHDQMIAFTSQLPHALAIAYVLAAGERDPLPFSAGSYRDVSRVAAINAPMWAELFVENQSALLAEMRALRTEFDELERLLAAGDRQGLSSMLAQAARMKEERL